MAPGPEKFASPSRRVVGRATPSRYNWFVGFTSIQQHCSHRRTPDMNPFSTERATLVIAGSVLLAGAAVLADGTRFSDFTPLAASAGPTADEATPITFGNPVFQQRSIADRNTQLAAGMPNSGNWDMNTVNETGRAQGPLPVHRVRDRAGRRAAPRPADRARPTRSGTARPSGDARRLRRLATGRRGARSSRPRRSLGDRRRRLHLALRSPVRAEEPADGAGHHRTR